MGDTPDSDRLLAKACDQDAQRIPALESPLLTRDEAAGYCRVGLRTFDRRVAPHVRALCIGARRLFDRRDIDTWLEMQKDGHCTGIRERRPSRFGSGLPGGVVIDPLARQIAQRLKRKLVESSER
jgi:hypothetical protein